ncbi:MAG: N-acyl amino acid synthase FeeM domain-containing protein, partial [Nannocystaceae bacterium]
MRLPAVVAPVLARVMARLAAGHPPHPCLARALSLPDIHVAQTLDEREAVYRFWYRIYVDIMGKQPAGADPRRRMIVDDLTPTATLLVATVGGKIVGTVRSLHLADGPVPQRLHDWLALDRLQTRFRRDQIAINGKVMVDPAWRGSPITAILAAYLYCYRRRLGILADTGWCAPALVPWFSRMGYRRYTDNFIDPDVGLRVPVMLPMADGAYLRRVHSPLVWCASNYPSRPADGR